MRRTVLHRARDSVARRPVFQRGLRRLARRGLVPKWISAQVQPVGRHPVWAVRGNRFQYESTPFDQMARRVVWTRCFDFHRTVSLLGELLPPGGVLVDVGAYTGAYALAALADAPTARAVCIEPNPVMFRALRANANANAPELAIEVHELALGDHEGKAELAVPYDSSRASLHPTDGALSRHLVRLTTLDALLEGRRVDVIKVDVEGGESTFLRGAARTIAASRPVLVLEFHSDDLVTEALEFLSAFGRWRCSYVGPNGLEAFRKHRRAKGFPNFLLVPE